MSNGEQQPHPTGAASKRSGGSWVAWAAVGTVLGVVISQYFPIFGGNGDAAWSQGRLVLIPLHVVMFGGVAALLGWSAERNVVAHEGDAPSALPSAPLSASGETAAGVSSTRAIPPPPPATKPADPPIAPMPAQEPAKAADKHEAITAPPPRMTDSADGVPTAQRLEIAAQVAQEEEDDRTLVGDLSQLAKAQELAELQRQHRDKKKAELAAAGPASSKKGQP